jgi:hypothetical protein
MMTSSDYRDIDAQIAESVLKYHREKVPPDASGENGGDDVLIPPGKTLGILYNDGVQLPPKGAIGLAYFVPQFSKSYDEAFFLLYRFRPPHYYTRIVITDTGKWRCDIDLRGGDGPACSAAHENLLVAICLCVLETAEVMQQGSE